MLYKMTKVMKLYLFPKDTAERRHLSEQSEMEHVKDCKIAENLSKHNKVSSFHVNTFKRLRRSTSH